MFIVIWEYRVKEAYLDDFVRFYASDGDWATLFKKGRGYLGTELLRDEQNPGRYLTLDRWTSGQEYEAFLSVFAKEYKAIDTRCEGWTESESLLYRGSSSE
jgi:heme-degrading monooxygenase HmoA